MCSYMRAKRLHLFSTKVHVCRDTPRAPPVHPKKSLELINNVGRYPVGGAARDKGVDG